jgi:hypothetical protein
VARQWWWPSYGGEAVAVWESGKEEASAVCVARRQRP